MTNSKFLFMFLFSLYVFASCTKDKTDLSKDYGKIRLKFTHFVEGRPLERDKLIYMNAALNHYSITELKYFISEVRLYKSDGAKILISEQESIHYIDEDIPETKTWNVYDKIETGAFDSISFVLGITEEKNKSNMFVNPPEVNMMWPDILGGGYHLMMMNGFWKDINFKLKPYNLHIGIGQIYAGGVINTDSITGYVQNFFNVNLPKSSFKISRDVTTEIEIRMNIDSWFETPHIYDFNYWGGAIMQKQGAMQMAKENGWDVFMVNHIQ